MILLLLVLYAQEATKPPEAVTVTTDVGYRFLAGQHGSINAYRSIVNLGEGPKVLGFESTLRPVANKWLDTARVSGANWGDPLNSVYAAAEKSSLYRLAFSYRNLAYFNALPSYANPQLGRPGVNADAADQRSYDTRQRFWNLDLDLRPGKRWQPFFGVARNAGSGFGVSPFVADENNYPAASKIDYGYTQYRGGLHYQLEHLHLTLEQGGGKFQDDTTLSIDGSNLGNRELPYLGRTLRLDSAQQKYAVRGDNIYSSAMLSVSPVAWADLTGQYFYTRPRSDVRYSDAAQGTLIWVDTVRFLNGQQSAVTSFANQPRSAGGFSAEVRPTRRVRVIEAWQTDRAHTAGSATLLTTLDLRAIPAVNATDRMVWNQSEQRLQAFIDAAKWLTVSVGHRYVAGDAQVRRGDLSTGPAQEPGLLRRNSVVAGLVIRAASKWSINADAEVGRGSQTYFRTSLQNFEQVRLRSRYQVSKTLQWNARYTRLNNSNPTAGVDLAFRTQQAGTTMQWTMKTATVMADYTWSGLRNNLRYLDPMTFLLVPSLYRDNAHTATMATDLRFRKSVLTVGGSLFRSGGSRPTRYYQPLVRLLVPVRHSVQLLGEWRNVSLGQSIYSYEAFGVQQITIGLRLTR